MCFIQSCPSSQSIDLVVSHGRKHVLILDNKLTTLSVYSVSPDLGEFGDKAWSYKDIESIGLINFGRKFGHVT